MYLNKLQTGLSFRNHGDLLLIGGNHYTGKSCGKQLIDNPAADDKQI